MSVFKIQQRGIVMQDDKGSQMELEGENDLSREASGKIREASEADVSKPVESATGEPVEKPDVMVKIDGPVSRVFTDALNKLLVQESYMTMNPVLFEKDKENDEDVEIQVYCWNGDDLNTEAVTQITNDVTRHSNRDFVIAVESTRVSPSMALLGYLEKLPNVHLCFSQEKALALVSARFKK